MRQKISIDEGKDNFIKMKKENTYRELIKKSFYNCESFLCRCYTKVVSTILLVRTGPLDMWEVQKGTDCITGRKWPSKRVHFRVLRTFTGTTRYGSLTSDLRVPWVSLLVTDVPSFPNPNPSHPGVSSLYESLRSFFVEQWNIDEETARYL